MVSYCVTKWKALARPPSCLLKLSIVILFPWYVILWGDAPGETRKAIYVLHNVVSKANKGASGFWEDNELDKHKLQVCNSSNYKSSCSEINAEELHACVSVNAHACLPSQAHTFLWKPTCSCDRLGSPEARPQPSPGPSAWRSGNTWAACPTGWRRHLARHKHSPSTSSVPASPEETVQTGRRPAGSLSPGSRWPQTSWQRRWAAPFAAETQSEAGSEQRSEAGTEEIKRRKKEEKIIKRWCARMWGERNVMCEICVEVIGGQRREKKKMLIRGWVGGRLKAADRKRGNRFLRDLWMN